MSNIYATHKPEQGSGGLYLKFTDGQTVKVRIASEPAIFQSESQPNENGETRISTRYGWLVWNQDEQTAQIIQQSATFFKNLAVLAQDEEYGDPTGYDIKIKRVGQGLETTYTITPSANREPLGASAKKELAAIDLIEKLKASPYAQHVMWLAEAENPKKAADPEEKKKDTVIENIGDEPINLDDIPF
jgi:hypothetical protein